MRIRTESIVDTKRESEELSPLSRRIVGLRHRVIANIDDASKSGLENCFEKTQVFQPWSKYDARFVTKYSAS